MRRRRPTATTAAPRSNNFDALRLVAAVLVVVGHAFILTGDGPPPMAFGIPIDTLGVYIFFSISGYLVTGSWVGVPGLVRFFRHRCLRIFPALVAVVLITVFVIGPAVSKGTIETYFASAQTWNYLQGLVLLAQYNLPGVFTTAVHARTAVNGSLWTLGVEFACYIAVALLGITMRRFRSLAFGILAAIAITIVATNADWDVPKGIVDAARVVPFFVAGAIGRLMIPKGAFRWQIAASALTLWLLLASAWSASTLAVAWLVVPFSTIAIGMASTSGINRAARFGDLSYGTYLWAFLIQQLELDIFGRVAIIGDVVGVLACTLVVAKLSWTFIERPALRHKDGGSPLHIPVARITEVERNSLRPF
jgi:peptidoglycan/LPS O-acetylase OafA/YrhL